MFGAGTILARSATSAPNMGVATARSGAAKCVLGDVFRTATNYKSSKNFNPSLMKSAAKISNARPSIRIVQI